MKEKVAEEKRDCGAVDANEVSVDWNGWNFLVIYGVHINGWFIAIPNWHICIEATEPSDVYYNISKLSEAFNDSAKGEVVAMAVKEHWEENVGND